MNSHKDINLFWGRDFQCLVRGLAHGGQPISPKLMNGKTFVEIGINFLLKSWWCTLFPTSQIWGFCWRILLYSCLHLHLELRIMLLSIFWTVYYVGNMKVHCLCLNYPVYFSWCLRKWIQHVIIFSPLLCNHQLTAYRQNTNYILIMVFPWHVYYSGSINIYEIFALL